MLLSKLILLQIACLSFLATLHRDYAKAIVQGSHGQYSSHLKHLKWEAVVETTCKGEGKHGLLA